MMDKKIAAYIALTGFCSGLIAAPTGETWTAGSGEVDRTEPNITTITQNQNSATIEWSDFDVAKIETVNFQLNGGGSNFTTTNVITGGTSAKIAGTINSAGNVVFQNPNGVFFTETSSLNVNSLTVNVVNDNEAEPNGDAVLSFVEDGSAVDAVTIIGASNLTIGSNLADVVNLDLHNVVNVNSTGKTVSTSTVRVEGSTTWTSESLVDASPQNIVFDVNSEIKGLDVGAKIIFQGENKDLTLGPVANSLEAGNEFGIAIEFNNINNLDLLGNINTHGNAFDTVGEVQSISIGRNIEIDTTSSDGSAGDVTLANIINGLDSVGGLVIEAGGVTINQVGGAGGLSNLGVNAAGDIEMKGDVKVSTNLELDAGDNNIILDSVNEGITLTADGFAAIESDIVNRGSRLNNLTISSSAIEVEGLGSVGSSGGEDSTNKLGVVTLSSNSSQNGYVQLGGDIAAASLNLDAAPLIEVNQDTTVTLISPDGTDTGTDTGIDTVFSANGTFSDNRTTEFSGDGVITIDSSGVTTSGANLQLGLMDVGGLILNQGENSIAHLNENISSFGSAGIDLSNGNVNIANAGGVTLTANNSGNVVLGSRLSGTELTVSLDDGDLTVNTLDTDLSSLTVVDEGDNSSVNLLGNLTVDGDLVLADINEIALSQNTTITTNGGDARFNGSNISGAGHNLSIVAGANDIYTGDATVATFMVINTGSTYLNGSITANSIDLSGTTAGVLQGDSELIGNLDLLDDAGVGTELYGPFNLTVNAQGNDLAFQRLGITEALNGLEVQNAGALSFTEEVLTINGSGGINLEAEELNIASTLTLDTSAANSRIDISQLPVDGAVTLILNAGTGTISLGSIGATTALTLLDLKSASVIELSDDIHALNETGFDFSFAQNIELRGNVTLDTSETGTNINLGEAAIDGTFDLVLNAGDGAVTVGQIGSSTALQNLEVLTTQDFLIDQNITTAGNVLLSANNINVEGATIESAGANVNLLAANSISMTRGPGAAQDAVQIHGQNNVTLEGTSGDVHLTTVRSDTGEIQVVAGANILNEIGDFVSVGNTSINLQANNIDLDAGQSIGASFNSPVVILVPSSGTAELAFGNEPAYLVNLANASLVTNGEVLDALFQGVKESNEAIALTGINPDDMNSTVQMISELELSGPLYAVSQAGYILPVNIEIEGDVISSLVPDVPGLYRDSSGWRLRYPIANAE